jgi:hypothetical protein
LSPSRVMPLRFRQSRYGFINASAAGWRST